ncbi:hypothetical protein RRG08_020631 [Elysia crispata]|uniref:Uncharacterized protein n=1 Tax=Elysia crispata TaxID=231223 RepID=A0AAE1ACJ0_9GAST|nr:hypothetical protein RRG08_020631 [Elysia crispata]
MFRSLYYCPGPSIDVPPSLSKSFRHGPSPSIMVRVPLSWSKSLHHGPGPFIMVQVPPSWSRSLCYAKVPQWYIVHHGQCPSPVITIHNFYGSLLGPDHYSTQDSSP